MGINELCVMQPYMRTAVPIKGAEQIRFNGEGLLEATYSLPEFNTVISNQHQYLYYMVKEGQLRGEIARNNVIIVNADMHDDFHDTGIAPPRYDEAKTMEENLDAYWEYAEIASINGFFVPLVYDGTLGSLSWLAYNNFESAETSLQIDRYRCRGNILPPKEGTEGQGSPMMIKERWDGEREAGTVDFFTFSLKSFPLHTSMLFRSMSEEELSRRFVLSIDVDRFVSCDQFDPQKFSRAMGPGDLNYTSLMMFNACMDSIKQRIRRPKVFICTSTPIFARPHAANVIIRRLVNIIRE